MSKCAAAEGALLRLERCCCKIRAGCSLFFKSQSFVQKSFYVTPAQVSIVDMLAHEFPQQPKEKRLIKRSQEP